MRFKPPRTSEYIFAEHLRSVRVRDSSHCTEHFFERKPRFRKIDMRFSESRRVIPNNTATPHCAPGRNQLFDHANRPTRAKTDSTAPLQRMPSTAGKRHQGRRKSGRTLDLRIKYTPRPHLTVRIGERSLQALIDTGSEISFINRKTAQLAREMKLVPSTVAGQVQLVDGSTATFSGSVTLPLHIGQHTIEHNFKIMLDLDSDVLIGVDLWASTNLGLHPPKQLPKPPSDDPPMITTINDEKTHLDTFLRYEQAKFEKIRGLIDQLRHQIRVLTDAPSPPRVPTPPPPGPLTEAIQPDTAAEPIVAFQQGPMFGPPLPPPILVTVAGVEIYVPYFAATKSRKYRARIGGAKYVLRFDKEGKLRYTRQV